MNRQIWTPGRATSRRDFLVRSGCGFGGLALSAMMASDAQAREAVAIDAVYPLRARKPPLATKAERVIFIFMSGGPSHVDTWDYKPDLAKLAGKAVPASFKKQDKVTGVVGPCKDELFATERKWQQHGQCGRWASDLFPEQATCVDDICFVHSLHADSSNHAPATFEMNTGVVLGGKPSMGAWVTYGLGTVNQNLPGFVLLFDVGGFGGAGNWGSAFLPAAFQGTRFRYEGEPVSDLRPPARFDSVQRPTLDAIQKLNAAHSQSRPGVLDLEGRIASYELAYRMQTEAADLGDLSKETAATQQMYGVDRPESAKIGRMCLAARRLVERGVRFVQVYTAFDHFGWDAHENIEKNHQACAGNTDRPIAGLLKDLKQRGLLDTTLVVCASEFGRTPMMQGNNGRNHNPLGFTSWLAGGGVKGGQQIGATDDIGLRAERDPYSVKDFHATILGGLGLSPDDLFYEHDGRPERLTGVAGSWKTIPGVFG